MQKKLSIKIYLIIMSTLLLTVFAVLGCVIINKNKGGSANNEEITNVATYNELYTAALECTPKIRIVDDIEITGTIYIPGETEIFVDQSYSLKRASSFLGEMFVVGEDENGENPVLKDQKSKLIFKANSPAVLTIDGNSSNITEKVKGSAVMVSNGSSFEMNNNVVIKDCKKTGNDRLLSYRVSYPDRIGGAAVVVASGSFMMNGGEIKNCESSLDEETSQESTYGGAVFNQGTVFIKGGKITNCKAARGGALYNYKITKIFAGEISDNYAEVYGGAIYNPNSQYANLFIGDYKDTTAVIIKNNTSKGSGGAIFSSFKAAILVKGATLFEGNKSLESNGGAINSPGANVIKNAVFKNNSSASKGGAVYAYYNSDEKGTLRHNILTNILFDGNTASKGGAVACYSSVDDMPGAKILIENCKFSNNKAKATSQDDSAQGGAIYSTSASTIEINNSEINNNEAETYGGGIYITGKSNLVISNIIANSNKASKGGFMYQTTTGTTVKIISGSAMNNEANESGGSTIWTNSAKVVLQIKGTTTKAYFDYNGEILGKGAVAEYEE